MNPDELNNDNLNRPALDDQQRQMLSSLEAQAGGPTPSGGAFDEGAMVLDPQYAEMQGLLIAVLTPSFAIIAPNWQLRPDEVRQLAAAYTPVMLKYFPDGLGEVGPELAAVMVTLTILGSRIGTPRRIVIVKEEAANGDPEKAAA